MRRWVSRLGTALVAVMIGSAVLTGRSPARSIEAFCGVVDKHKNVYLGHVQAAASGGGLSELAKSASALGDLKGMWKDLAAVAPSDIQGEVEKVSEAWQKQDEKKGLGKLLGSLGAGLLNAGSIAKIASYTTKNCGAK